MSLRAIPPLAEGEAILVAGFQIASSLALLAKTLETVLPSILSSLASCISFPRWGKLLLVTRSYLDISPAVARRIKLIMTDVDGTLTLDGEHFEPAVAHTVRGLEEAGMVVGLVSGRTLPRLERIASLLGTNGPLIAENGGVAKLGDDGLVDLGYSRQPALAAVTKLKALFPGAIQELWDNKDRLVDVTIACDGLAVEQLQKHAPGIQLLDSGYMIHLMPEGISKGGTLKRLLPMIADGKVSPDEVVVFGDSPTDVSLFEMFCNSVLVLNPRLPAEQREAVAGIASYSVALPCEQGFVQVAKHIIKSRFSPPS